MSDTTAHLTADDILMPSSTSDGHMLSCIADSVGIWQPSMSHNSFCHRPVGEDSVEVGMEVLTERLTLPDMGECIVLAL